MAEKIGRFELDGGWRIRSTGETGRLPEKEMPQNVPPVAK